MKLGPGLAGIPGSRPIPTGIGRDRDGIPVEIGREGFEKSALNREGLGWVFVESGTGIPVQSRFAKYSYFLLELVIFAREFNRSSEDLKGAVLFCIS